MLKSDPKNCNKKVFGKKRTRNFFKNFQENTGRKNRSTFMKNMGETLGIK